MAMNIIVQIITKTDEEQIIPQGTIVIDKEQNIAKIGNGKDAYINLPELAVPLEVIQKWLFVGTAIPNSKLVTLPDMNFAYTVIDSSSQQLVEDAINSIIDQTSNITFKTEDSVLEVTASTIPTFVFNDTSNQEIEAIKFKQIETKNDEITKTYSFSDKEARNNINNTIDSIVFMNEQLENLNNTLQTSIVKTNPIVEVNEKSYGTVSVPTNEESNFFLRGDNTWQQVRMYGDQIPVDSATDKTIAESLSDLQAGNLNVGKINDNDKTFYVTGYNTTNQNSKTLYYSESVYIKNNVLMGAAWNDYAEARETNNVSAGRVVVENGDDTLSLATERLMLGGNIVSDTYGMLIGESENAHTPIALCGRVLAYPYENRDKYYPGAPVCTGPNGTVSLMSKDEVLHYPECIIGYVSAIPSYEEWNGIKVNGRIWIKVH